MPSNSSHVRFVRKRRQTLDEFDRLPRAVKEIIWYAPVKLAVQFNDPASLSRAMSTFLEQFSRDTEDKYGRHHPQSYTARISTSTIEGEELDF